MATYAVGDLQGCLDPLRALLDEARFDPAEDRLWLVGDLVNRGPASLETLRFLRELGDAAVTVLGNHDLHLLAVVLGGHSPRRKDTLDEILAAPDLDALVTWLRTRRLVHFDPALDALLVHAGVPFLFSLEMTLALAKEVEDAISGPEAAAFFEVMYGNEPARWAPALAGHDRLRVAVNYFTRMRFLYPDGALELETKESTEAAPDDCTPWFDRVHPDFAQRRVVFGHWAALEGRGVPSWCRALDTGCVWGGCLTLLRLEDEQRWQVPCERAHEG